MMPAIIQPGRGPQRPPPDWREQDGLWLPPRVGEVSAECGGTSLLLGGRRRATVPVFSPSDIAGMQWWLDAQTLSTLAQDAAGTTPITTGGQTVGYWGDRSGNARHATQATSGKRPAYVTSGIAGHPAVQTDGVDDVLTAAGITVSGAQTVVCVYQQTTALGSGSLCTILAVGNGTVRDELLLLQSVSGYQPTSWLLTATGTTAGLGLADALDLLPHRLVISRDASTGTAANRDATTKSVVTSGALTTAASGLSIGARPDGSLPGALLVGEVIVYDSQVTGTPLANLISYLTGRWT